MGQDPNFHISVPSGWAKLCNAFDVHICPMHYLSHDSPLNLAAFMWLSPIFIVWLFEKNSNCHKFRQNALPFHNQWKIWTLSVHSILMLWRPNLVKNCNIVYRINWYLHNNDTIIIWVVMSWCIIRSYPYPQNSGIPEVVTIFFDTVKKTQQLSSWQWNLLWHNLYTF